MARRATLDGAWAPPTIGDDPTPTGLSADGKTLVLIPAGDPDPARTTSRFAIVPFPPIEGAPELAPRVVELPGALDFDAISPDGRILYVVQHLDGEGGYQVRAVDLPAGTMRPDIITDKRNLGEAMAGWPLAQLRSPSGMVLTLYRGTDHPFIHALNTAEAWAVCIDLPGGEDATDERDWGLAASTGWGSLLAVNATRGLAVDLDPRAHRPPDGHAGGRARPRRSSSRSSATSTAGPSAAGRGDVDGSFIYRGRRRRHGRLAADLSSGGGCFRAEGASIGLLPDGRTLFALEPTRPIEAVDAPPARSSGRSRATATTGSLRSCPGSRSASIARRCRPGGPVDDGPNRPDRSAGRPAILPPWTPCAAGQPAHPKSSLSTQRPADGRRPAGSVLPSADPPDPPRSPAAALVAASVAACAPAASPCWTYPPATARRPPARPAPSAAAPSAAAAAARPRSRRRTTRRAPSGSPAPADHDAPAARGRHALPRRRVRQGRGRRQPAHEPKLDGDVKVFEFTVDEISIGSTP